MYKIYEPVSDASRYLRLVHLGGVPTVALVDANGHVITGGYLVSFHERGIERHGCVNKGVSFRLEAPSGRISLVNE